MDTTTQLPSDQIDAAITYLTTLPNFDHLSVDEAVEMMLAYLADHA